MDTNMVKEDKMREVVSTIEANPEQWDNAYWASTNNPMHSANERILFHNEKYVAEEIIPNRELCGTTFCVAGWACTLAGYRVSTSARVFNDENELVGFAASMATEILGLNHFQADKIFFSSVNNVEDLKRVIEGVTGIRF